MAFWLLKLSEPIGDWAEAKPSKWRAGMISSSGLFQNEEYMEALWTCVYAYFYAKYFGSSNDIWERRAKWSKRCAEVAASEVEL